MMQTDAPGKEGLALLRRVTPANWLRQPEFDFSVFAFHDGRDENDHRAFDFSWDSGRPGPHVYDKNSMYLGAASSAWLGVGVPEHVLAPELANKPGIWRIHLQEVPPGEGVVLPPLVEQEVSWQYTPIMLRLRNDPAYKFYVSEAWIFPEGHQVLRPFYEQLRALRQAARTPEELKRVKRLYTVSFGILAHQIQGARPGYLYRPDWFFGLVSYAKLILYQQMERVWLREMVQPSAVHTDAIHYPVPISGLPLGTGIGQFKYKVVR